MNRTGVVLLALILTTALAAPVEALNSEVGAVAARAEPGTCPLTGKEAALRVTRRVAVAVRVGNESAVRPISVGSADMVIETLVEGGTTRLIPIFHCSSATTTGPVRSARGSDATITGPYTKLFAFSGAHPLVLTKLSKTKSVLVTEATDGEDLFRDPAGSTDVNSLRANLASLRTRGRAAGVRKPKARFTFGKVQRGRSASRVTLNFGSTTIRYRWRRTSKSWARSQNGSAFLDASGKRVTANNVLVQEVAANASLKIKDAAGAPSPRFDLKSIGRAFLFRNGKVIVGEWIDDGAGAPAFHTKSGAMMRLAKGRTWLEMVPSATGELKGSITFN